MRVLIVKMSSMGDIIHTLPAISDASQAIPGIQLDWLAEEAFAEIPSWHPQVNQVIAISLRQWRKTPWQVLERGEIRNFYKKVRRQAYDYILDAQGSIKSAIVACLAHGYRLGMDRYSIRERFAHLVYQKDFFVPRQQHAVCRLRQLFAQALGYPLPESLPDYGLNKACFHPPNIELPRDYLVFVPNASWPTKCWSEKAWSLLLKKVQAQGLPVFIPWGNAHERERARRISQGSKIAQVLPSCDLGKIAAILACAKAVVSVDTGLSHLTAALGTAAVVLYGPTNPHLIGTIGLSQVHLSPQTRWGSRKNSISQISPEEVWEALRQLVEGK